MIDIISPSITLIEMPGKLMVIDLKIGGKKAGAAVA